MSDSFPPDVQQFVRQELASGNYRSEEKLVLEAVRFFRDSNLRLKQLREELRVRLERLDRGDAIELDDDKALQTFFDEIESEVHQELAAGRKQSE